MNPVSSIIICFHSDIDKVNKLIEAVEESVDQIMVFDNVGLDAAGLAIKNGKVKIESRGVNLGIAAALTGC